ncbi:hypothetical protein RchiOBHm_Chr1g0326021 [Rosa chinensis]|uniref:Uncharacterized protein n=1 Tax=Rosa chinensis TaxID=74649 RepID=A0A2P6SA60_ROSCH|nr:hypothetical protein RchiOBHm_Chr1g0326021 [Rosa chinensis]
MPRKFVLDEVGLICCWYIMGDSGELSDAHECVRLIVADAEVACLQLNGA